MSEPLIHHLKFQNLSYGYEGSPLLFENVDFDFPMFETVWIQAPGGQGRSSLLQILAGLLEPTRGKYFINDLDVGDMTFEEFLPYRLKIGYGFDFGGLLNNRTVLENLTLPLLYHKITGPHEAEERAMEYLTYLGIHKYKDQRPAVVPGGVRKLTCMIRALVMHPEVLLLDDPSVGMNEETVLKYFDLVTKIKAANALQHVFVSSYDSKLARSLSAREVVINDHKLYLNEYEGKWAANT